MDKIFEALASDILSLPISVLFVLLLATLIFYFFKDSLSTWLKKEVKSTHKIARLKHHRFFNTCDKVEQKIKAMTFITNGETDVAKTKMMHKLISMKCETMREYFTALLLNRGIDDWGVYELQHEFKACLGNVVEKYNRDAYTQFLIWGVSAKDADFLIQNYEDYRDCMVEGFIDGLDSVLMNSDYANNFDKVNTLMELCSLAIYVIPKDVRSSFEQVNGRYTKYSNNGNF